MCVCAPPRTPVEGVTVYGRSGAQDVRKVQQFFEDRGVVFDYVDLDRQPAEVDRVVSLSGQHEAAVVEIGRRIFVGYEPDALESVLP
jgi:glutaredoxin